MNKEILVYIDLNGSLQFVGRLWTRFLRGKENASFEYDSTWLKHKDRFALEPALSLGAGVYHTGKSLFGAFGDSAPDRWGRILIQHAERRQAIREKRTMHTLMEIDYLLAVDDEARQGALRFRESLDSPFLADNKTSRIPPLIHLPKLLSASARAINNNESDNDLKLLLAPGSSLGGARPKVSIRDKNGNLTIAKFPHPNDDINAVLWESLALTLAAQASIVVPQWRIEMVAKKPILLLQRFDRFGTERIPFLSAMSMLNASDNETHSYMEIADALRQYGAYAAYDIQQLWRRLVFNILISNADDHLRNHAFLYEKSIGWRLSPAYDLNPVPADIKPHILSTAINYNDTTASLELALSVAEYFGLSLKAAKHIITESCKIVLNWRSEAVKLGITKSEIDRMASAFELADSKK